MGVSNHASEQCFETSALRDLDTVSKRQFRVSHPYTYYDLLVRCVQNVVFYYHCLGALSVFL